MKSVRLVKKPSSTSRSISPRSTRPMLMVIFSVFSMSGIRKPSYEPPIGWLTRLRAASRQERRDAVAVRRVLAGRLLQLALEVELRGERGGRGGLQQELGQLQSPPRGRRERLVPRTRAIEQVPDGDDLVGEPEAERL